MHFHDEVKSKSETVKGSEKIEQAGAIGVAATLWSGQENQG